MSSSASSAVGPSRPLLLRLYRRLLQQGHRFADYNIRETAKRKIQQQFRDHRSETDVSSVSSLYKRGEEELSVLQRQVLVHNLYHHQPYVIEQQLQLRTAKPQASSTADGQPLSPGAMQQDESALREQLTPFTHATATADTPITGR